MKKPLCVTDTVLARLATCMLCILSTAGCSWLSEKQTASTHAYVPAERDLTPGRLTDQRVVKQLSVYTGTNIITIMTYERPNDDTTRHFIFEDISVNQKSAVRRVLMDRDSARQYVLDDDRRLLEVDEDGDGYFEVILFTAGKGFDIIGFKRRPTEDIRVLEPDELQEYRKAFSVFTDPPQ